MNFLTNNKREQIIEAALTLFAERGYHGTNVPDIAKVANVGTGTIYRNFKSKEDLVNSIYQIYIKKLADTVMTEFPTKGSTYEQYEHIIQKLILFAKENKEGFIFIETHNHTNYLDEFSKVVYNEFYFFLQTFILEGVKNKKIRVNLSWQAIIAIIYGAYVAIFKSIEAGTTQETPELMAGLKSSLWDAIKS